MSSRPMEHDRERSRERIWESDWERSRRERDRPGDGEHLALPAARDACLV